MEEGELSGGEEQALPQPAPGLFKTSSLFSSDQVKSDPTTTGFHTLTQQPTTPKQKEFSSSLFAPKSQWSPGFGKSAISSSSVLAPGMFKLSSPTAPTQSLFSSTEPTKITPGQGFLSPSTFGSKLSSFQPTSFPSTTSFQTMQSFQSSSAQPSTTFQPSPSFQTSTSFQPAASFPSTNRKRAINSDAPPPPYPEQNDGRMAEKKPLTRITPEAKGIAHRALADASNDKTSDNVFDSAEKKEGKKISPKGARASGFRKRSISMRPEVDVKTNQVSSCMVYCTGVDEQLNKKQILKEHFSNYGRVVMVRCSASKSSALVTFANHSEAARAIQDGTMLEGKELNIRMYKQRNTSSSTPAKSPKSSKLDAADPFEGVGESPQPQHEEAADRSQHRRAARLRRSDPHHHHRARRDSTGGGTEQQRPRLRSYVRQSGTVVGRGDPQGGAFGSSSRGGEAEAGSGAFESPHMETGGMFGATGPRSADGQQRTTDPPAADGEERQPSSSSSHNKMAAAEVKPRDLQKSQRHTKRQHSGEKSALHRGEKLALHRGEKLALHRGEKSAPPSGEKSALHRDPRLRQRPASKCSVIAKSNADKVSVLERIDKSLRLKTIKQSDVSKVQTTRGTCPDMCPEKERYLRQERNLIHVYEMDEDKQTRHELLIKEYSRSSADQEEALPHELRPPDVLRITMDYMITHMMNHIDHERVADWYDFVWNRTRAIRKEISIQQANDVVSIQVAQECARFHICCAHELCEEDCHNFDPKINNENLEKTMKTVLDMYADTKHSEEGEDENVESEAEFKSYYILLNINKTADVLRELQNMRVEVRSSPDVQLSVAAFSAVHSRNYARFFCAVERATYLQAALLHRYFSQVRLRAVELMKKAYHSVKGAVRVPACDVIRCLRFNDDVELGEFCAAHGVSLDDGTLVLARTGEYGADGPGVMVRSELVAGKMQGRSLGEVISHGRRPSAHVHQPWSSFDRDGRYVGMHADFLTSSKSDAAVTSASSSAKRDNRGGGGIPGAESTHTANIVSTLEKRGIPNQSVKMIARDLFNETIDEFAHKLARDVIHEKARGERDAEMARELLDDLLNRAVDEQLRYLALTTLAEEKLFAQEEEEKRKREMELKARLAAEAALAKKREEERRREEEERRRQEEERERQKKAAIEAASAEICDEVHDEVVNEIILEAATAQIREVQLDHFSHLFTDDLLRQVVSEAVDGTAADVYKQERKASHERISGTVRRRRRILWFCRWRQMLMTSRRERAACESFPSCPSVTRDFAQQVARLLLPRRDVIGDDVTTDRRRSFPLDRDRKCNLSLDDCVSLLQRDEATRRQFHAKVDAQLSNRKMAQEERLPLERIVFDRHVTRTGVTAGQTLWKLTLICDEGATWIRRKLGCEKETTFRHQTFPPHRHQVATCCKVLNYRRGEVTSQSARATSAFVLAPSSDDLPTIRHLLMKIRAMYEADLYYLPPVVLVTSRATCDCLFSRGGGDQQLDFVQTLPIENRLDFVANSKLLTSAVEWLAAATIAQPPLIFTPLRDVLERQLLHRYMAPLHRHARQLQALRRPPLSPHETISAYNHVITMTSQVLTDDSMTEYDWPALEFYRYCDKIAPPRGWNSESRMSEIGAVLSSLLLPEFPPLVAAATASERREQVLLYCHRAVTDDAAVIREVASLTADAVTRVCDDLDRDDCDDVTFPWQPIVESLVNGVLRRALYDVPDVGETKVGYDPELLDESVRLPTALQRQIDRVQFQALDVSYDVTTSDKSDDATHAPSGGANLQEKSSETLKSVNSSHSRNQSAADTSWLVDDDDDVTFALANHTRELHATIRNEHAENDKFEKHLQQLLLGGNLSF